MTIKKRLAAFYGAIFAFFAFQSTAFANAMEQSLAYTGTKKMLEDALGVVMVLSSTIGGLLIAYFLIRRSAADEQDQKRWGQRVIIVIVSVIGIVLASSIVTLVTSYYPKP